MCCPRCHSTQFARSRRKTLGDIAMRLWRMQPFRCLDCHKRFHVPDCVAENIRLRKLRKRASVTQVTRPVDAVTIPGAVAEVLPS